MNKKVLTLCAGFLLAGGLTSSVLAADIETAAIDANQYYYVFVNNSSTAVNVGTGVPAAATDGVLDVNGTTTNDAIRWSKETNRSTWWRVETVTADVNGQDRVIGYRLINALTNKPLTVTTANGTYSIFGNNTGALEFADANGSSTGEYYMGSDTQLGDGTGINIYYYNFQAVPTEELTKNEINSVNNDYFGLQFGYINDDDEYVNYESLNGSDPFVGQLVAKDGQLSPASTITPAANSYFIYNETADAFVVLLKEKWSDYNTNLDPTTTPGMGHRFALMTAKEIIEDQAQTDPTKRSIATYSFKVNMPVVVDYSPLEVVAVNAWITDDWSEPTTPSASQRSDLEMLISNMNGQNYLNTVIAGTATDADSNAATADLKAYDSKNTVVRFGSTDYINMSQFYGYAITIKGLAGTGVENMTVRPDIEVNTNLPNQNNWIRSEYISFSRPEAQWIVTSINGAIYLTNRETKASIRWNEAFDMLGNGNTLALRHESGDTYVYGDYKFEIKKVAELGGESFADYGVYDQDETEIGTTRNYKVTFVDDFGTVTYVGINGTGDVLLTRNEANAINFDLVKTVTTDTLKNDGSIDENAVEDVFYIVNDIMAKNKDGEWEYKVAGDTLSFFRYKLAYGDQFLTYNENRDQFELVSEDVKYVDDDAADLRVNYQTSTLGDNFIVKLKENDKLNVVKVVNYEMDDIWVGQYYTGSTPSLTNIYELGSTTDQMFTVADLDNNSEGEKLLLNGEMMFFDFNNAEVQKQQNIYAWNANAQLTIAPQSFNSYRYFATPDTMEFYRVEYADEFLYEKTTKVGEDVINFLGMTYNRDMYNPAIYVDTAYIQDTKKPTYLLAVDADIEPSHQYCPIHGIDPTDCPADHQTTIPGYVTARYLVSFTDSVDAHAAELNNPYLEDGKYTKLGFVDAVHGVNDLNIIQNGDTVKTYELTNAAAKTVLNPVEFAFRIVNQSTQDFIIESVNKGEVSYIRWQNGVPVLTTDITDAEVFNVRETSAIPTANEEISAEAGAVSVVATDGAIIVKGAEGKNVVVATILGKVVANEVATSDNETIAVPAGIAVVAVDGESFKVVVK